MYVDIYMYRHKDIKALLPVRLERGAPMYVHTYACISSCIYIHSCQYIYMHTYIEIFIYVYIHKDVLYIFPAQEARRSRWPHIYACLYVYTYVYIYIHACIFIYASVCSCTYINIRKCMYTDV